MSTPLSTLTTNVNFLQQVNFKLTIQRPSFTNLEYYCTSVNLPSVTMGEVKDNYRNQQGYFPGDTLAYDTLRLKFMVDENMANYTEAYNWMLLNATPNQIPTDSAPPSRSDLILSVLTSKNTFNKQFQFRDAFPTSIGELAFNAQAQSVEYISCEMTLRFNNFVIVS